MSNLDEFLKRQSITSSVAFQKQNNIITPSGSTQNIKIIKLQKNSSFRNQVQSSGKNTPTANQALDTFRSQLNSKAPNSPSQSNQLLKSTNTTKLWTKLKVKGKAVGQMRLINKILNQNLYGMDDAAEDNEDGKTATCMLLPDNFFRRIWNFLILMLMLYTATILPYKLVYEDDNLQTDFIDNAMSYIFILDLVLTFFSAYYETNEILITSHKVIAFKYLKSWFLIDLLACIPFNIVIQSFSSVSDETVQYQQLVRLARLSRLTRLTRMIRLLKLVSLGKYGWIINRISILIKVNGNAIRMIKMLVIFVFLVHLFACFYFLIAKLNDFDENTWVYHVGIIDQPAIIQYLYSVYWSMQTICTIGFGDIKVNSNTEKIFAMTWMCFGVAFYSFMISNLQSVASNEVSSKESLKAKINLINEFARDNKLDDDLVNRIKKYVEYKHKEFSEIEIPDQTSFIQELPYTIKAQLLLSINAKIVGSVPFFIGRDIELTLKYGALLKPFALDPGQILYAEGDHSEEVFFLSSGTINLKAANDVIYTTFAEGEIIGAIEVLGNLYRQGTAQAKDKSTLFSIKKDYFLKMIEEFPNIGEELKSDLKIKSVKLQTAKRAALESNNEDEIKIKFGCKSNQYPINTQIMSTFCLKNKERTQRTIKETIQKGVGKAVKEQLKQILVVKIQSTLQSTLISDHQIIKSNKQLQNENHKQHNQQQQQQPKSNDVNKQINQLNTGSIIQGISSTDLENNHKIVTYLSNLCKMYLEKAANNQNIGQETYQKLVNSYQQIQNILNNVDDVENILIRIKSKQSKLNSYADQLLNQHSRGN